MKMNQNKIVIDYLNNLRQETVDVKDILTIEKTIDLINEKNCIINWELYHEMKNKDKEINIETEIKYNKNRTILNRREVRDIYDTFGIDESLISDYLNKIIESAQKGQLNTTFESMESNVLISLEKLGFSVEWYAGGTYKGWLVSW